METSVCSTSTMTFDLVIGPMERRILRRFVRASWVGIGDGS
jgi:hypothetical protein